MNSWRENVKKVTPYVPGEQPKLSNIIKLNTNENPYPPAPGVLKAIDEFDGRVLNKYPEPNVSELRAALGKYHGVDPERVFVGVGSDDVLAMCFLTYFNGKKPIVFADITYSFYDVWASLFDIPYKTIPLKGDFSIDVPGFLGENGGVVIANPNAPTGMALEISEIQRIIQANKSSVVIVDEAYVDFGGESALKLTDSYDNLVVCRTFSKSRSMAGARIGYCVGGSEIMSYLHAARNSFNSYTIDSLGQKMAMASVEDDEYFKSCIGKIKDTRQWSVKALEDLGFKVLPSSANFVFASHKSVRAEDIFSRLREKNIFVRYFNKPRIDNYLRITIGTDEEMDSLMKALGEIVN